MKAERPEHPESINDRQFNDIHRQEIEWEIEQAADEYNRQMEEDKYLDTVRWEENNI